jgi:hypothetical protein
MTLVRVNLKTFAQICNPFYFNRDFSGMGLFRLGMKSQVKATLE